MDPHWTYMWLKKNVVFERTCKYINNEYVKKYVKISSTTGIRDGAVGDQKIDIVAGYSI